MKHELIKGAGYPVTTKLNEELESTDISGRLKGVAYSYLDNIETVLSQVNEELNSGIPLSPMDRGVLVKTLTEIDKLAGSKAIEALAAVQHAEQAYLDKAEARIQIVFKN